MSYFPPQFKDFGKNLNDLFKKKYDYSNTVTIKRSTDSGLKVETKAQSADNALSGSVKLSYKEKGLGDFEATNTSGGDLKGKAKFTDLADGVVATLETAMNSGFSAGVTVDYTQDHFAGSANLNIKEVEDAKEGDASVSWAGSVTAAAGWEGISLGGKVNYGAGDKAPTYDMGFNFAEDDFQFSLVTADSTVTARFFQQVSKNLQSGFKFDSNNTVTVGIQNKLDSATTLKASINTQGVVNTALNYTLANPSCQVNVASQFQTAGGLSWTSKKYGLGLTLGDF